MEISFIRHGESLLTEKNKMTATEFKKWVERYNDHGVFENSSYPAAALEKAAAAFLVITSDLKRSIESARLLNPAAKIISDPLFRETELPIDLPKLLNIKLKPNTWSVSLRLLWLCGYSNECESLNQAKSRAVKASQQLIHYANEYESIVLVGHGFFNRLIAKELQKKGWQSKRKVTAKHWSCITYTF
ncbi:histidine phosphatase family protein [Neobacillus sp. SM06]|uniref:histidine phosphatase family protein n=1 Tax=Neobacillus sp. SM06 TaxID=3422492 RepID=UPI003D268022